MRPWTVALLFLACSCGGAGRPTADPGVAELNAKKGVETSFDASASRGQISSFTWDFGDGSDLAIGKTVTHVFAADGDFNVTLTVKGPGGIHSANLLVHVGAACNAVATINVASQNPQPGSPVLFTSGGSSGCGGEAITLYSWDFGDGQSLSGADKSTANHTYAMAGTYQVKLTIRDAKGNEGQASRALNVGVTAGKPLVSCPMSLSGTVGNPVTFSASGSDSLPLTYTWTFAEDMSTATGSTVQRTYMSAGSFTATVVAKATDQRTSDPCTSAVTITAPISYTGTWLLNPMSSSLTGCTHFTTSFPATHFAINHTGANMTAAPSGNGWPAAEVLSGVEDPPPAQPGTFRVKKTVPNETKPTCGSVSPEHGVRLTFTSTTTATGSWTVLYSAGCIPSCPATCNCIAKVDFTAIKQ